MKSLLILILAVTASGQDLTRSRIFEVLRANHTLDAHRRLVHLSQVCSLHVDGKTYPVIDIQETVKGAMTPRGVNRVIVLDGTRVVQALDYTTQRPLFCEANQLFVYGDLKIENIGPEGNVLSFTNAAKEITVSRIEANDYPVPETGARKTVPQ